MKKNSARSLFFFFSRIKFESARLFETDLQAESIFLKMIPAECWGVSKRDHRGAPLHVFYTVYCVYAVLYIIKQIHPVFW